MVVPAESDETDDLRRPLTLSVTRLLLGLSSCGRSACSIFPDSHTLENGIRVRKRGRKGDDRLVFSGDEMF